MLGQTLGELVEAVGRAGDIAGVVAIGIGFFASTLRYLAGLVRGDPDAYGRYRGGLGKALLLGLEILVAADVIRTVAVEPTLGSVAVLAGIVVIRTFLSWALQLELEGRWPWQSRGDTAPDVPA